MTQSSEIGTSPSAGPDKTSWDDLLRYVDPRDQEPAASVEYTPENLINFSQSDLDYIATQLRDVEDEEVARVLMIKMLTDRGVRIDDIQNGMVPILVDGEPTVVAAVAHDFGTHILRVDLVPRLPDLAMGSVIVDGGSDPVNLPDLRVAQQPPENESPLNLPELSAPFQEPDIVDSNEPEFSVEQDVEALNYLMGRLRDVFYEASVEGGLKEHLAYDRHASSELGDVLKQVDEVVALLSDNQMVDASVLRAIDAAVTDSLIASGKRKSNAENDRRLIEQMSSSFDEVSSRAQRELDIESPERKQFYYVTTNLQDMCSNLQEATNRKLLASDGLSSSLKGLLSVLQELISSRHGHETFVAQMRMYTSALRKIMEESGSSVSNFQTMIEVMENTINDK